MPIVIRRMRKPNVPAVAGSIRRMNVGSDEAADGAGQAPAQSEDEQHGDDTHNRFKVTDAPFVEK